jgi:proteasome alpha subunit
MDEVMSLAISAINLKSDEKGVKHIRMSKIKTDTKLFEKVSQEELAKHAQAKDQHAQAKDQHAQAKDQHAQAKDQHAQAKDQHEPENPDGSSK